MDYSASSSTNPSTGASTPAHHPTASSSDPATAENTEMTDAPYGGRNQSISETSLAGDDNSSTQSGPSAYSVGLSIDTDYDTDSAMGDDRPSSSVSVTSSIYQYVEEFGRTWHKYKEGKYFLPNDEQEQLRLNLQHTIACMVQSGNLFLAPLEKPNRVIDIGTGTGIWAIEFADMFPESDVLGTDLSPIQPDFVPTNCRFEIDDAEDDWAYTDKFDYIHGRYLCISLTNWPLRFQTFYNELNPGGWCEFQETIIYFQSQDGSVEGTALQRWNKSLIEGFKVMGRDPFSGLKFKGYMEQAGFINVEEKRFAVPGNPWAKGKDKKLLGAMQVTNSLEGVSGLTMAVFSKALGWTKDEIEILLVDVRKDMADRHIHSYITIVTTYGQKPMA